MKSAISEKDLKSALASTLRRQHLLGAVPGAQRLLPLGALALGDLLARKSGTNLIEQILCGSDLESDRIEFQAQADNSAKHVPDLSTTTVYACKVCSHKHGYQATPPTNADGNVFGMNARSSSMYLQSRLHLPVKAETQRSEPQV